MSDPNNTPSTGKAIGGQNAEFEEDAEGIRQSNDQSTTQFAPATPSASKNGGADTETVAGSRDPSRSRSAALPLAVDPRYRIQELLGEGGMGRVYRAFDQVLEREVALKVMRDQNPQAGSRLLREARAQSRMTHDNVCRIYDAGEVDGQTYVSMQLITGPSLRQAAASMPVAEKIDVVAQAAEGVHAAHRLGLIHRDLKPGNIMLEQRPGGGWRAFVVDFGLVRDLDAAASSTHGLAGTPQYMAPEQIRGQVDLIDWRTDVWALGVTLFELLVGNPLFPATSPAETLIRVLQEDVRFPPAPRLPRDLRAIIERCLTREVAGRYASARELAEDLRRFLAGTPVLARPVGPLVRATRLARRHPRLTVTAGLAVVGLLGLASAWAVTAQRAERQAEIARTFGEKAAAVEAIARYGAFLPPHDTRHERGVVRLRIEAIERESQELGELAEGPGAYAQGRGWLALGKPDQARRYLEKAWAVGNQNADVACALGQTLADLYQRGLYEARGITSREMRISREKQLAAEFREPSLAKLRAGVGATYTSPALVEAQIALVEERWDDAIAHTQKAAQQMPWLFEALRRESQIWLARAQSLTTRGEVKASQESLQKAGIALATAIDMARSDSESRAAQCQRRLLLLKSSAKAGLSPEPLIEPLRQACEAALEINPDEVGVQSNLAHGYIELGEWQLAHGQDPTAALLAAIGIAQEGIACNPQEPRAHNALGVAAWRMASNERKLGRDPSQWSARALASFETSSELDPSFALPHGNRGVVLSDLAQDERNAGRDPLPLLMAAMRAHNECQAIDPTLASAAFNRGVAGWRAGEWANLHGLDARPYLQGAIIEYRTALTLNPTLAPVPNALGAAYSAFATYLDTTGGDPVPSWREAERWYEEAISRRPDDANPRYNLARLLRTHAERAMERGEDPMKILEKARREAAATVAIDARDNRNHMQVGSVELLVAQALMAKSASPEASLTLALKAITKASAMNPKDGVVWINQARLHKLRAQYLLKLDKPWEAEWQRALAAIDEAQRLIPTSGQTRQIRAELLLDSARASTGSKREKAIKMALAAIEEALAQNPNIAQELTALRKQAEGLSQTKR